MLFFHMNYYLFWDLCLQTISLTEPFLIMATDPFDDSHWLFPQPSTATSTNFPTPSHQMEDITSASYIPRMARTIPHSTTVHTIFIKKITYPMTSRPDELWILERTTDGIETWRPVETFLENLQLSQDPRALRATANQWRHYYDVPTISSSTPITSRFPALPHPEHTNVHFGQPVSTIPDHTYILQSCWGRSAQYHSQVPPTSLSWPPWRSTPPSSPPGPTRRTMIPSMTSAPITYTHGHPQPDQPGATDMSDSSV